MKPGEYWRKRFKLLEEAQNDTSVKKAHEVQEQFRRSQAVIENKINAWYQRLADNNGVSMIKARELLRRNELEEFRWSVEDYIKAGKENAKNQAWQKELENASAKVHINRLEALMIQTQAEMEKLFGNVTDTVDGHIRDTYENGFYHTAYEIQKGIGIGSPIQKLDERTVDKIVSKPWAVDGKDFSGRIWENRTKLVNKLNNSLTKMCITGASPDTAIREISKSMEVSRKQAVKIVMTESAAFSNLARKECMNDLDVEQFEVVETLDGITCKVCAGIDGKHYQMSEYVIGVTAPPFHPICRGCTCPYFDDEFSQDGERAARGEDGKTYYVPADMTYENWNDSFVGGKQKSDLLQVPNIGDEKIKKANESFEQILLNGKPTPHTNRMLLYSGATDYKLDVNLLVPFAYNPSLDAVLYNPQASNYEMYDMNYVQAHEISHRMDMLEYESYNNDSFIKAVQEAKDVVARNSDKLAKWFEIGGKYRKDAAISDIISALSNNEITVLIGHEESYWANEENIYLEIFANISSMDVLQDTGLADFRDMFADLYKAYEEVVK